MFSELGLPAVDNGALAKLTPLSREGGDKGPFVIFELVGVVHMGSNAISKTGSIVGRVAG
jgi:hypothetical protein